MNRIALVLSLASSGLVACSSDADIGVSGQPVTCQAAAAGVAKGTVTNLQTHASYSFGTTAASLSPAGPTAAMTVALDDSKLALRLQFSCGQPQLGMFDVGAGQQACPFLVNGSVSGNLQQVYATGHSGTVILDQNVGCIAGRYDIDFGTNLDQTPTYVDQGHVAGWFSIPLQ